MQDETSGLINTHFIILRSKMCMFLIEGGIKDEGCQNNITFDDYLNCPWEHESAFVTQRNIYAQNVYNLEQGKIALNTFNEKTLLNFTIETVTWVHHTVNENWSIFSRQLEISAIFLQITVGRSGIRNHFQRLEAPTVKCLKLFRTVLASQIFWTNQNKMKKILFYVCCRGTYSKFDKFS